MVADAEEIPNGKSDSENENGSISKRYLVEPPNFAGSRKLLDHTNNMHGSTKHGNKALAGRLGITNTNAIFPANLNKKRSNNEDISNIIPS